MVYIGFTDKMLEELQWINGRKLKTMICINDGKTTGLIPQSVYGNLFLYVDDKYVEVGNLFRTINYFGNTEDISVLFCKLRRSIDECINYQCSGSVRKYAINDTVNKIIVIRDKITVHQIEYELKFVADDYKVDESKGERELDDTRDLSDVKFKPYIYNIILDQALVLECSENTYIFLRGSLFTEEVLISVNRNYMGEICTVDEVKRYWKLGNESLRIEIKREKIES